MVPTVVHSTTGFTSSLAECAHTTCCKTDHPAQLIPEFINSNIPMQASAPKQARTMAASQEPPWHGMKGMTRITSEFKVSAVAGNVAAAGKLNNIL